MIISCVILNFNDADTTLQLINKIKDYSLINYIIVVDNNSTDNSYQRLLKLSDKKIIVIKSEKNGGYGYGNNVGIRYSYNNLNSDYTLIVNPDVIFEESIILPLVEVIKDNEHIAISSCVPKKSTGRLAPAWKKTSGLHDVLSSSVLLNRLFKKRYYKDNYYSNKNVVFVYQVPGSLLMVDTKLMINHGMYDETFFLYEEEKILATKMEESELKTVLLLNYDYIHNHSVSISKTFKSRIQTKKLLLESKYKYLKKYRNFNKLQLLFANIFFKFTLLEILVYGYIKDKGVKN